MNITITESDYDEYMSLLENRIKDLKYKHNSLQATIDNWNDKFNPTSQTSGLTIEEMKDLQNSFKESQQKHFDKWHLLNRPVNGTPNGYIEFYNATKQRELKQYLIR